MLLLYRLANGFVELEISGENAECFINICVKNGITLWHIRRSGKKLYCRMTVKCFKAVRTAVSGKRLKIHITKKIGLPFLAARYRKRYGILVGVVIFFAVLKLLSCFVWTIDVVGNERVNTEKILAACTQLGVKEGMKKRGFNPKNAGQKLLLSVDGLSWAAFNVEGCKITVNVSEMKDSLKENSEPSNLKAKADGIITKIDVTAGNCVVKAGDTVKKGDLLVSGVIENENNVKFVHSIGKIEAKTQREITVSAGYVKKEKVKTGKVINKRVIELFGFKIPLYLGCVNEEYESSLKTERVSLFGNGLPLRIYTRRFEILEEKTEKLDKKHLENELLRLFAERVRVEKTGDFEVENREFDEIEGGMRLKTLISASEDIASEDILLFNTGN